MIFLNKLLPNFKILVQRKHIELVPHEMTEADFWGKFFQSHYFHRERATEVNSKDPFSDCIKMDENGFYLKFILKTYI